jgi:hypothetical protein
LRRRALAGLKKLNCSGSQLRKASLSDTASAHLG